MRLRFDLTFLLGTLLLGGILTAQTSNELEHETRYLEAEARAHEDQLLELSLETLETLASDPAAYSGLRQAAFEVHLGRTEQMASALGAAAEAQRALANLQSEHLTAHMRARLLHTQRQLAVLAGDVAGAKAAARELAPLLDWFVLGPLDNERGRGSRVRAPSRIGSTRRNACAARNAV